MHMTFNMAHGMMIKHLDKHLTQGMWPVYGV